MIADIVFVVKRIVSETEYGGKQKNTKMILTIKFDSDIIL